MSFTNLTPELQRSIAELSRLLTPQRGTLDGNPYAHMIQGVVVGVHLGGLDIQLRGQVNPVENVRYMKSYVPGFADNVWCLRFGSDLICLGDLETQPGIQGQPTIEDWHVIGAAGEPGFLNSWVNFGAPHAEAAFALQSDGWVRLKGLVKNGSTLTASMFQVPAEYRPPATWGGHSISNGANTFVNVSTAGFVNNAGAGGSTAYVSLAGITWPTAAAWDRERDTSWFPLVRSLNGWTADTADINFFPMIYRRADGWRYLKGNVNGGTGGAGTTVSMTHLLPDDAASYSEMFSAREEGVGQARVDIRGLSGELTRVTGGVTVLILAGITFWSRKGENVFSIDPSYPHKSMQVWKDIADTETGGFLNGWINYNTGLGSTAEWRKFQFFKDDFGIVHLRGLVNGVSKTADSICQLPAGYRPLETQIFPTMRNSGAGGVQGRLDVVADGTITAVGAVANWHSIWGQFKAEA